MADILVIYMREDKAVAGALVNALQAHGVTVWWDTRPEGGVVWDSTVKTELKASDCIVAVWSKHAIESEGFLLIARYHRAWVRSVVVDDVTPPRDFQYPQRLANLPEHAAAAQEFVAVDLSRWTGDAIDPAFSQVMAKVRRRLAQGRGDRATVHYERKDYDLAIAECNRAIEIDPGYTGSYRTRIDVHLEKKDFDQAIAECSEVIDGRLESYAPKIGLFYIRRAFAHLFKREHERAIADSTKAIELLERGEGLTAGYEWLGRAYNVRAIAYGREGMYDRAIRDLTRALRTLPMWPARIRYHLGRAQAYEKRGLPGDNERAKADYRKVLEDKPAHAEATQALARLGNAP